MRKMCQLILTKSISVSYTRYMNVPPSRTFPLGKVAQQDEVLMFYPSVLSDISPCEGETMTSSNLFAHMGAFMPPLNKGRTPRRWRGVYCHCRDSTSEVNDTPKRMKRRGESLISPAPDRGGRRRAAAAPGPGCRLPATAKTADGGRAVRGCPHGWKPADRRRY